MKFRILIDSLLVGASTNKHFTDAIYYEPEDLAEDNYARLFLHIEIVDNPKSSKLVTQTIFSSLKEFIYKDLKRDPYDTFEESLKHVNQALNNLRHDDKDWIGKVNATCGIFSGDSLHVSTTGKAEAILVRKMKMSVISDGLAPSDTEYDNLFTNIASGTLKTDDYLIINSHSLLPKLSEDQIVNAISKKQLANSVLSLEKILDGEYHSSILISIQNSFKKAALLEEENVDIEDTNEPEEKEERKISNPITTEKTKTALKKGKNFIFKLKEIFVPPENTDILDEDISSLDLEDNLDSVEEDKPTLENILGVSNPDSIDDIKAAMNKNPELEYSIERPNQQESKLQNTIKLFKRNLLMSMKGMKPGKKSRFKKSNVIAVSILIIVAIFAINSVYSKHQENIEIEALREQLLTIDNLIEKAKGRNIIDEKEKAREVLAEIETSMTQFDDAQYLQNEIEEKRMEIKDLSDSINEIIRVDIPKEYANLSDKYEGIETVKILKTDDTLYAVAKDAILKLIFDQTVLIPITILNENEYVVDATPFEANTSILLYTNQNRMLEFKRDEFVALDIVDNAQWKNAVDIDTFGRRVYLLDPSSDQIWKYPRQGNTFLAPEEYKPYKVDTSLSIDMSIIGDIYILNQDGVIHRTNSRELEDYEYQDMPENTDLSSAIGLVMNPTLKQLFILDPANNRILITGYRGLYAKQYVFPQLNDIKDILIDENADKMYVLTSSKVFEVDLKS